MALLLLLCTSSFRIAAQTAPVTLPFRINGGGPLIVDALNNNTRWESDSAYNLGNKGNRRNVCSTVNITPPLSTLPAAMYCSQRFYSTTTFAQPFQYNIPVLNNANYTVVLHFAELVRLKHSLDSCTCA